MNKVQGYLHTTLSGVEIQLPYYRQRLSNWCWAACLSMTYEKVTGKKYDQCSIAGDILRRSCCPSASQCDTPLNINKISPWLNNNQIRNLRFDGRLTFSDLRKRIDNNDFVIAAVTLRGNIDHMIIINGYSLSNRVLFLDPVYGERESDYHALNWFGTWIVRGRLGTKQALANLSSGKAKVKSKFKSGLKLPIYDLKIIKGTFKITKTKYYFSEVSLNDKVIGFMKTGSKKSKFELYKNKTLINRIALALSRNVYRDEKIAQYKIMSIEKLGILLLNYTSGDKEIFEIINSPFTKNRIIKYSSEKSFFKFISKRQLIQGIVKP